MRQCLRAASERRGVFLAEANSCPVLDHAMEVNGCVLHFAVRTQGPECMG